MKLTKNELRTQQNRLTQFQKYLPTLQLKKAMLQFEVTQVEMEIEELQRVWRGQLSKVESFSFFLLDKVPIDLGRQVDVIHVKKHYENIAGVEIPLLDSLLFRHEEYALFDTPIWTERAIGELQELVTLREKINIAMEKRRFLEKELREVSIRVNLFEKVLIPRAMVNIKKIKIFLGDQQLAAVSQAKVAKKKIDDRRSP
jgi:V/A-type H+-transporting ATPase subunit D